MNRHIIIFCFILLFSAFAHTSEQSCDRIAIAMSDGCKSIIDQLLSIKSLTDPNSVCCINFRYKICQQSVKTYAAVARVTKICPEEYYDSIIKNLDDNPLLVPIKTTCQDFDSKKCFTDKASNLWNNVKSEVNTDIDKLSVTINKNWNQAIDSLSVLAKDIGKQFEEKSSTLGDSMKDKAKEFGENLKKNINEQTQKLKDIFSNGNANNRYSIIEDQNTDSSSGMVNSFVHSIIPDVEFVGKETPTITKTLEKASDKIQNKPIIDSQQNNDNGNSFMNFFHSIAGTLDAPIKTRQIESENSQNPYSV